MRIIEFPIRTDLNKRTKYTWVPLDFYIAFTSGIFNLAYYELAHVGMRIGVLWLFVQYDP